MNWVYILRCGDGSLYTGWTNDLSSRIALQDCITRQIRVQGSCASSGEYDICLNMIAGHSVDLTPFLQVTMPLEQGKEAFRRLFDREPGLQKIILTMD